MQLIQRLVSHPAGALSFLALSAFLEVFGDSYFQTGFYRSTGVQRVISLVAGVAVLAAYGALVNVPRWDFGKLLGVYVVLFFIAAQILNRVRFGQSPSAPVYVGGALIVAGGLVMLLWTA